MDDLFFNGWQPLLRMIIVGICSYVSLIVLLRVAGKRTLSRMNAYDMVITMALGSVLAKVLLTPDLSIAESVTAMLVLIASQYTVSVIMCHSRFMRNLISAKPDVLFHEGHYITDVMKKERVDKDEIAAAMHEKGINDLSMVEAVILGTNGDLSVILKSQYVGLAVGTSKPSGDL